MKLKCEKCGANTPASDDAVKIVCARCNAIAAGIPKPSISEYFKKYLDKKNAGEFIPPRGWAFKKEFVFPDGRVFHKGKEIAELRGTLSPTIIIKKEQIKLPDTSFEELIHRAKEKRAAKKAAKTAVSGSIEYSTSATIVNEVPTTTEPTPSKRKRRTKKEMIKVKRILAKAKKEKAKAKKEKTKAKKRGK